MLQRVKLVRIAQGYHSYQFAAMVGIHPNTWHAIELGRQKPSEKVLLKACEVLRRPAEELFADAEEAIIR